MAINVNEIESELTKCLILELNIPLLETKATVLFEQEGSGRNFSITPFFEYNPSIYVYYENTNPVVYVTIGQNTVLEVPIEGKGYTDKKDEFELLSILKCIVNKGFDEKVWKIKDRIIKSVAKLDLEGETDPVTISTSSLYNPFSHKTIVTKHYIPFY
jgi:hypothetical protein